MWVGGEACEKLCVRCRLSEAAAGDEIFEFNDHDTLRSFILLGGIASLVLDTPDGKSRLRLVRRSIPPPPPEGPGIDRVSLRPN